MNTKGNNKIYFENLDALRFFSFLAVFFYHSFHTEFAYIKNEKLYHFLTDFLFANGNLGVNFFFVLSGFLITYLLLIEKEKYNRIAVGKFYLRRVLRIWPLYFMAIFYGFIIFPELKSMFGGVPNETANPISYLLFFANFDLIQNGLPDASVLGVLWSISIEEQFYIIWPLIFFVLPKKTYPYVFPLIIIQSLVFRVTHQNYMLFEYHSLSCISDMAVGGMGAWLIKNKKGFLRFWENIPRAAIAAIWALLLFIFLYRHLLTQNEILNIFERLIISMVFLSVILEQNYSENSWFKLGRIKWAGYLGRISYGLYCLHFIGILIAINLTRLLGVNTKLWQVIGLETVLALAISIGIAYLSYRFYESPFLKLKTRLQRIKTK